jgi:ubiquinone biosynthesis protein UbiJ
MNNRLAQQAIKQAASRVKSGVQQGAESFVEREVGPLRARVDELERELAEVRRDQQRLAERLERLERAGG